MGVEDLATAQARLGALFEAALSAHVQSWTGWPPALVAPCRYVLEGGGKRVRPLLAMLSAEAVGGDARAALPWALALEMVHTYSLVHDDLPSMDDDDVRRGKPSCHVAFGEATAILTGDALLTEAFAVLGAAPWPGEVLGGLVALLGQTAGGGGMVGGQVIDIGGEPVPDLPALVHLQRLKTAALFRAAAEGGGRAGGAEGPVPQSLATFGEALGLLFQVTDDVLDRAQDAVSDGSSWFHHVSEAEVLGHRDRLVAEAKAALKGVPSPAGLRALVDRVAYRTT